MRAGQSTIQQTLMPEAAAVLSRSAAEAARRCHSQTTPIHVATTLLSCPSGLLRRACVRTHPAAASHPLQCRALELCFSVALDRIPSAVDDVRQVGKEPPISNALMAALKRAQAHQRRGCPENQQQPLLAVKVELEPLVVSILDDPSVSRVMREAGFSSPAVKAVVEQSMTSTSSTAISGPFTPAAIPNSPVLGRPTSLSFLGPRPTPVLPTSFLLSNRNLYLNPFLHPHQSPEAGFQGVEDEVEKVLAILRRSKKSNPVLVGDTEPRALFAEVLQKVENKLDLDDSGTLSNIQVVSLDKEFTADTSQLVRNIKELSDSLEERLGNRNVIVNLGDLKWLVEPTVPSSCSQAQQQHLVPEHAREAVTEMGKLLRRFDGGGIGTSAGSRRVWLIGVASCATYLRCQVYHPIMEKDWDLQAVPIAPRAPAPTIFTTRAASNKIFSSKSIESMAPNRVSMQAADTSPAMLLRDSSSAYRRVMCPVCTESYQKDLSQLTVATSEKQPPPLPQWLQAAKQSNTSSEHVEDDSKIQDRETRLKESADLLKRWSETCSRLHSNTNALLHQQFQLNSATSQGLCSVQRNDHKRMPFIGSVGQHVSPHQGNLVMTDLGLGHPWDSQVMSLQRDRQNFSNPDSCKKTIFFKHQEENQTLHSENSDDEFFKKLLKGLSERVQWQLEAASAVAVTVLKCKSGNGKRMGYGNKADTWLMFAGPDKLGKMRMASALSELIFGNYSNPVIVSLVDGAVQGHDENRECNERFRGKTVLDRVVESIRRNPFAVFVLEDVDQADLILQRMLERAMERGRLHDSHGREVSLGGAIFIMTTTTLQGSTKTMSNPADNHRDEKLNLVAECGWRSSVSSREKPRKHQAEWQQEESRPTKTRKDLRSRPCLDLNLTIGIAMADIEAGEEGSPDSSDITCENEEENQEYCRPTFSCSSPTLLPELVNAADDFIVFNLSDSCPLQRTISGAAAIIGSSTICGSQRHLEAEVIN